MTVLGAECGLDIWVINDVSTDESPQNLSKLQTEFPRLQVHHCRESKGGKAGALNAVFPFTRGEIILIIIPFYFHCKLYSVFCLQLVL
ncbi:glycosyltransferase [Aerosakkonemataceae cyanobacterium BLCC-F50]|uniref:Glycosyltransferase n=1 Tax=Floridaenema flaviceps BLCC-F50 TaxID=3153642 RepID=A0ABV4XQ27_9CYAN